jgi:L-iditol 2-dehydrogenase
VAGERIVSRARNGNMTAAVLYGKEDVRIEQVAIPKISEGEVLVQVQAALTCGTDLKVFSRGYHARMIKPPALFGHELAGIVVEAGKGAEHFAPGTRVVAANSAPCGACFYCRRRQENLCDDLLFNNGAYAEFIRIPRRIVEKNLLELPPHLSFQAAAMTEPLACVLLGLNQTQVIPGDTVVIIGGGPIGLMFVQVAKAKGCRVISVVKRDSQAETARRFGVEHTVVLDQRPDPIAAVREITDDQRGADAVIEAVGRPEAWQWAIEMVRKGGAINFFGGCASGTKVEFDTNRIHYSALRMLATFHHTPQAIRDGLALIAENKVRSLEYITAQAPLAELPSVLRRMLAGSSEIKTAIIPSQ